MALSATFDWLKVNNSRWTVIHCVKYAFANREKLARIDTSPICRQQFVNMFANCCSKVHIYQLQFANTILFAV